MARITAAVILIAAISALAGCGQKDGSSLPFSIGLATPSAQTHKELTIDEVRARLRANPKAKLADVRTEAEYKDGHIEGAIVIPLDQARAKAESLLNRDEEIIFYCHDGPMGTDAARILTGLGYTNVANMKGGINQWRRQGLPVVQ